MPHQTEFICIFMDKDNLYFYQMSSSYPLPLVRKLDKYVQFIQLDNPQRIH